MATASERLADAQSAYHDLITGRQARVFVDQNGERIEYSPASQAKLSAYIEELKRQVNGQGNGPMRVYL
jgi:hypothetical protein